MSRVLAPQESVEKATIPSWEISTRKNIRPHLKLYSILAVVHRLLRFSSMKVLLLPPETLSVAVLILSFVARLSLLTKTDPCHFYTFLQLFGRWSEDEDSWPSKRGSFITGDTSWSRSDIFISFEFSYRKIYLIFSKRGFNHTSTHSENVSKVTRGRCRKCKIKRMVLWEDQFRE